MPAPFAVRTARLAPGVMGLWDQDTGTIWLDAGLSAVERRCTLVHELVHAERGDVPCADPVLAARQERAVDREAARRLVPLDRLLDALRWGRCPVEVAADLEVDLATLAARVEALPPQARAAVEDLLADDPAA